MTSARPLLALLTVLALASGCRRRASPEPAQRVPDPSSSAAESAPSPFGDGGARLLRPGSLEARPRTIDLGVYLPQLASPALVDDTKAALRTRFPDLRLRSQAGVDELGTVLLIAPPAEQFYALTVERLGYFGRGLDEAQMQTAVASKGVLMMSFELHADPTRSVLREIQRLVLDIAQRNAGFVWDDVTRELYTTAAWDERRVSGWEGDLPDIRRHITIHYYATEGGRHRAITLGMGKFGLPDLVVSDLPESQSKAMTTILDAMAQLLVEGAGVERGGRFHVDLSGIRHPGAKAALLGDEGKGAMGGPVDLAPVAGEEGDPANRLVQLRFTSYPGATEGERQAAAIVAIVGAAADPLIQAPDQDPELAAATVRAQARLPAVAAAFRRGLPLGERIVVKAPFSTDDGSTEWMWIGVTGWPEGVVQGRLESEPYQIKSLHMGAKVSVKQASLADYVWMGADGAKKEGGESADILRRREARGTGN